jgi:hypothetical protein
MPDNKRISGGKCSVPHFEGKFKVDQFIKQDKDLFGKTTFFWPTYYATNFVMPMIVPSLDVSPTAYKSSLGFCC